MFSTDCDFVFYVDVRIYCLLWLYFAHYTAPSPQPLKPLMGGFNGIYLLFYNKLFDIMLIQC